MQIMNGRDRKNIKGIRIDQAAFKRLIELHQQFLAGRGGKCLMLEDCDLSDLDMSYSNMTRAMLIRCDLSRCNLRGTKLSEAMLNGTIFDEAILTGANLEKTDLRGSRFIESDLTGASLARADLRRDYNFSGADGEASASGRFTGARLENVSLQDSKLRGVSFKGASIFSSDFGGADLSDADFGGARIEASTMKGARMTGVDMTGASLDEATKGQTNSLVVSGEMAKRLSDQVLKELVASHQVWVDSNGADGKRLDVAGLDLTNTKVLRGANLSMAVFRNAMLSGVDMSTARLMATDFQGANLADVKMTGADIRGADFRDALQRGLVLQGALRGQIPGLKLETRGLRVIDSKVAA